MSPMRLGYTGSTPSGSLRSDSQDHSFTISINTPVHPGKEWAVASLGGAPLTLRGPGGRGQRERRAWKT